MVSINLDDETERYLVAILAKENTTSSELIERLLREYLESIQAKKNFLERWLSN
ncbi:ribbon-helix-helix protein, CopG family [Pseudanabaena sp. 'Roaring Creek']|uniref:ribbon-helix-helix protein, CopG family n=1 Tax=Pseudanabaena sp. 'Roaring Creek' TaxID=1681830 RepID=UPI000ACD02DE|nr:ribbon-helix-helix protein, CopG family [Pseudanabaena sp. 'Roaring Creek']